MTGVRVHCRAGVLAAVALALAGCGGRPVALGTALDGGADRPPAQEDARLDFGAPGRADGGPDLAVSDAPDDVAPRDAADDVAARDAAADGAVDAAVADRGVDARGDASEAACPPNHADCDGNPANGCETNTNVDVYNCGRCGVECVRPCGTVSCVGGWCAADCSPGFGDCDGDWCNGCEANLLTDPNHCGGCSIVCGTGQICVAGICQ
jgi:hypothetical protein